MEHMELMERDLKTLRQLGLDNILEKIGLSKRARLLTCAMTLEPLDISALGICDA